MKIITKIEDDVIDNFKLFFITRLSVCKPITTAYPTNPKTNAIKYQCRLDIIKKIAVGCYQEVGVPISSGLHRPNHDQFMIIIGDLNRYL